MVAIWNWLASATWFIICSITTEDASLVSCSASVLDSTTASCGCDEVVEAVAVDDCDWTSARDNDVKSKEKENKNIEIMRFTSLKMQCKDSN